MSPRKKSLRHQYLTSLTPVDAASLPPTNNIIRTPEDAYQQFRYDGLVAKEQEALYVLALNARHRVLASIMVALGGANQVHVKPKEIFRPAIMVNAAAVIVGHNHPSGDATPSVDDRAMTESLQKAGELLGIPLLDHLVVTRGSFWSLASKTQQLSKTPPSQTEIKEMP